MIWFFNQKGNISFQQKQKHISIYTSIYLFILLSIYLCFYLSIFTSIDLFIILLIYVYFYLSFFIGLSIYLSSSNYLCILVPAPFWHLIFIIFLQWCRKLTFLYYLGQICIILLFGTDLASQFIKLMPELMLFGKNLVSNISIKA